MIAAKNLSWFAVPTGSFYAAVPHEEMADAVIAAEPGTWMLVPQVFRKEGEDAAVVARWVRVSSINAVVQGSYGDDDEAVAYAAGMEKARTDRPELFEFTTKGGPLCPASTSTT